MLKCAKKGVDVKRVNLIIDEISFFLHHFLEEGKSFLADVFTQLN